MVGPDPDDVLIKAWDEFDRAAFAMLTASAVEMTKAADRLERTRVTMRNTIIKRMTPAIQSGERPAHLVAMFPESFNG